MATACQLAHEGEGNDTLSATRPAGHHDNALVVGSLCLAYLVKNQVVRDLLLT
jgi:hypothetical protein